MRWPMWIRRRFGLEAAHDPRAAAAARDSRDNLAEAQSRQPEVDRVARMLRELGQRNHFAESVQAALRARGER